MLADKALFVDVLHATLLSNEPPKVTDWWSVIVACGALVVASVAAFFNWRTNQNQAKQLESLEDESRERKEQERRHQASQIWAVADEKMLIWVCNESDMPIYDVTVTYIGEDHTETFGPYLYLDPALKRFNPPKVHKKFSDLIDQMVLGDSEGLQNATTEYTHKSELHGWERRELRELVSQDPDQPQYSDEQKSAIREAHSIARRWASSGVQIMFRDANGVRWYRDNDGRITERQ